jgi:hypothetical protein
MQKLFSVGKRGRQWHRDEADGELSVYVAPFTHAIFYLLVIAVANAL